MASPDLGPTGGVPAQPEVPGKEVALRSLPGGKSLATPDTHDETALALAAMGRPPIIGQPLLEPTERDTSTTLKNKVTDPRMRHKHNDIVTDPDAATALMANAAVESIKGDPDAQALIFDFSLSNDTKIIHQFAAKRGIVVEEHAVKPSDFIAGTRPDQFADLVERAMPGEEGTIPERGIARELDGVLHDHYGRPPEMDEVDYALRFLDAQTEALTDPTKKDEFHEELKYKLAGLFGSDGRKKLIEDRKFASLIDLVTTWKDSEPKSADSQNRGGAQPGKEVAVVDTDDNGTDSEQDVTLPRPRAQIIIVKMPEGEPGRQMELRGLVAGRLPQLIKDFFPQGTPTYLGIHAMNTAELRDAHDTIDLARANDIGWTQFSFLPARTDEDFRTFVGSEGTPIMSSIPTSVAGVWSENIGTYHGDRVTSYSDDDSVTVTNSEGKNGSVTKSSGKSKGTSTSGKALEKVPGTSKGQDNSKSTTEGWSKDTSTAIAHSHSETHEVGELPIIEPSELAGLQPGEYLAFPRGEEVPLYFTLSTSDVGPHVPLDVQLEEALPGITIGRSSEALPRRMEPSLRTPIEKAKYRRREQRRGTLGDARAELEAAQLTHDLLMAGFHATEFITPEGDLRVPVIRGRQREAGIRSFAGSTPETRERAIRGLAREHGVPREVVDGAIQRERESTGGAYQDHQRNRELYAQGREALRSMAPLIALPGQRQELAQRILDHVAQTHDPDLEGNDQTDILTGATVFAVDNHVDIDGLTERLAHNQTDISEMELRAGLLLMETRIRQGDAPPELLKLRAFLAKQVSSMNGPRAIEG